MTMPLRIPIRRQLPFDSLPRPLQPSKRPCHPRLFTQNSQLLLISPAFPRPQLPFLHSPSALRVPSSLSRNQFQTQLLRFITTERKRYIKDQVRLAVKWTVIGWTVFGLFLSMRFGIENEILERRYPAPPDWSWISRWNYRTYRHLEAPNADGTSIIDWPRVGTGYKETIARLENAAIDGAGLCPPLQEDGDIYFEGLGKSGLDVSSKSEPWRRGYHECLMGAARAAEHLDTLVRDTTRNIAFPPEVVIGPSNPRPRPVPYGAASAPREENCEPAFESPETYYLKIITSQGFTPRQRLEAALAYADWLDFKGLHSSAEDVYDWGLDIATGALPTGVDGTVDTKTGIINEKATYITPNILIATTALASHHAQNNNLSTALPIFLSILRAQRSLPPPPPPILEPQPSLQTGFLSSLRSFLTPPSYPPAPPSSDLPATRTPLTTCDEAATMAHIGEILFASSRSPNPPAFYAFLAAPSSRASNPLPGFSWTRSSISLAESTLRSLSSASADNSKATRERCAECLNMGMENWGKMVEVMRREAESETRSGKELDKKGGWFWSDRGSERRQRNEEKWAREANVVQEKSRELRRLLKEKGLARKGASIGDSKTSGTGALFG